MLTRSLVSRRGNRRDDNSTWGWLPPGALLLSEFRCVIALGSDYYNLRETGDPLNHFGVNSFDAFLDARLHPPSVKVARYGLFLNSRFIPYEVRHQERLVLLKAGRADFNRIIRVIHRNRG